MIADVRGVVTGATKAGNTRNSKHVIETADTRNVDLRGVEKRLSTGDRLTIVVNAARSRKAAPSLKKIEDIGIKRRACRI